MEIATLLARYDPLLENHLRASKDQQTEKKQNSRSGRGATLTFLSNRSQNKLIDIIGNQISQELKRRIDSSLAWSLIADTTPDITHHEQISICVRIVSPDGDVSEHLLLVERAEGVTAEALYTSIVNSFEKRNISLSKLVAQTYDGAANMSGCYRGLQVLIKENVGQHVLFVHCHAHVLNLVLADVAMTSVDTVTLFNFLETLYVLLTKSLKVSAVFEDKQKERGEEIRFIKRLNTVRWSSREACLTVFLHYTSIYTI